ncbi:MAG: S-layer homology domain-containing protein [Clostridiales bacterium]|jgi:hypothetical protein|nr:S-layer homology domain-containing protein [Clostridiales bacterium]
MKNYKKIISLFLTVVMVVSLMPTTFFAAPFWWRYYKINNPRSDHFGDIYLVNEETKEIRPVESTQQTLRDKEDISGTYDCHNKLYKMTGVAHPDHTLTKTLSWEENTISITTVLSKCSNTNHRHYCVEITTNFGIYVNGTKISDENVLKICYTHTASYTTDSEGNILPTSATQMATNMSNNALVKSLGFLEAADFATFTSGGLDVPPSGPGSINDPIPVDAFPQALSFEYGQSKKTATYSPIVSYTNRATASSGLTPTYRTSNSTVATVNANGVVTAKKAGKVTITASQAGNGTFLAAPDISYEFEIGKAQPQMLSTLALSDVIVLPELQTEAMGAGDLIATLRRAYSPNAKVGDLVIVQPNNGQYVWQNPEIVIGEVGTKTYYVKFIPQDPVNYETVTNIPVTVIVEQANPNITQPNFTTYYSQGEKLSTLALPTSSSGSFTWDNPNAEIGTIGIKYFNAKFTPNDTKNYKTLNLSIKVTVKDGSADSDGDRYPNKWEEEHGFDPDDAGSNPIALDPNVDTDGDGLKDSDEFDRGTEVFVPDTDGDGLTDGEEIHTYDTDPLDSDSDDDGLTDGAEVKTHETNPKDSDTDDDGLTDGDEVNRTGTDPKNPDTDSDGLDDKRELELGLDPLDPDYDDDGISDGDEIIHGTNPKDSDTDDDGLNDGRELELTTDPLDPDTDKDTLLDGVDPDPLKIDADDDGLTDPEELELGTDPLKPDTDDDGLTDPEELELGTDPLDPDTDDDLLLDGEDPDPLDADIDDDGLIDGHEKLLNTDLYDPDTDDDGLTDGEEVNTIGSDPLDTDTDDDVYLDGWEVENGYDPLDPNSKPDPAGDTDGDGLTDGDEINIHHTDPTNNDTDGDTYGDGWEVDNGYDPLDPDSKPDPTNDSDGDGLTDGDEINIHHTDPSKTDTDGDGYGDGWEVENGYDPLDPDSKPDPSGDTDGDGVTDGDEINNHHTDPTNNDTDGDGLTDGDEINNHHTDPTNKDTDGDGYNDGWEVENGYDPLDPDSKPDPTDDTDGDGLTDGDEMNNHHTDPTNKDTDGDGYNDGWEVENGYDPLDPDSKPDPTDDTDGDGLTDGDEINNHHTDPTKKDTDGDGYDDNVEIQKGTDPLDKDDHPGKTKPGSGGGGGGGGVKPSPSPSPEPSPIPDPSPSPKIEDYVDLKDHWSEEVVIDLIKRGIIKGYDMGDGTFRFEPEKFITRAEIVQMLFELSGEQSTVTSSLINYADNRFPDYEPEAWYAQAVAWASSLDIVIGYEDSEFRPGRNITRQEMAIVLTKYSLHKGLKLPELEVKTFNDQAQIADWSISYVKAMQKAGIINGDDWGNMNPTKKTKRAEAAQMIYNMLYIK